ncbi:amino acid ABC transporter permease [Collimonas silvisoli]|uniref:amino acid ABC transporter permease n=1 Tax=Collimonas silvisoli TaxID=2825884 RepID=UPI001B8C9D58|nr:amino acid ABC transporter permease [Collimonas silvisoli]
MNQHINFSVILQGQYAGILIKGIELTFELALFSWILAFVLGVVLATIRMTNNRIAKGLVSAFVAYHRNVPMLVQIMMWYFALPSLLPQATQMWINQYNGEFLFSVIAIGLCMAAYISEDIRSGLRGIPHGQFEASRALGLSYIRSMWYVILPQAMRIAIPPLVNHTVLLFKNSSLAMAIGVAELTYATRQVENYTFRTFESYMVASVFYLLLSLVIMAAGALLTRHYRIPGSR